MSGTPMRPRPAPGPALARVLVALAVGTALLVPAAARAQAMGEDAPAARDRSGPDLDEIIAKHAEAIGGSARIAETDGRLDVWDVTLESPYVDAAGKGSLIVRTKKPLGYRSDVVLEFNGQTYLQIHAYDGETGWRAMQGGPAQRLGGDELTNLRERAIRAHGGDLVGARERGAKLVLKGRKDVEGTPCHVIEVIPKEGREITHFIDAETYLTVKSVSTEGQQGYEVDVETYPSDYRRVEGLLVPHELEVVRTVAENDAPQLFVLKLRSMEFGPDLDDAIFALPEGGAPQQPKRPAKAPARKLRWY